MFFPELQKLLNLMYDLTRKERQFIWGKEQQIVFEEIKCRLVRLPVLHLPNSTDRFHLYSDKCKFAMGITSYQIQNGKPKLIAYAGKRLPEAAKNYSITELKMCGLAINITRFFTLIKENRFQCDSRSSSPDAYY